MKTLNLKLICCLTLTASTVLAGSLTPPSAPAPTMHTLDEIYQNQLEILAKIGDGSSTNPVPVTVSLSDTSTVVQAGYYQETTLDTVDPDLAPENIKAGVTIFGITGTYGDINTTNGLIAYYPLDGDTLDYSGNGHHGTGTNLVVVTNGVLDAAYDFNGSSSYIRVPNYPELLASSFTVVTWIKTSVGNRIHGPIACARSFTPDVYRILILNDASIQFSFRIDYNQGSGVGYPFSSHFGEWTMVSTVYDGVDMRMYINNQLVTVEPFAHGDLLPSEDFLIGAGELNSSGSAPDKYFSGSIDEVRVYDKALTADEIGYLHTSIINP